MDITSNDITSNDITSNDITSNVKLNNCSVNDSVKLLCFKMYYTLLDIDDELRFNTIYRCATHEKCFINLFAENENNCDIFALVKNTNKFINNVSEDEFIKLFGLSNNLPAYSINYLKEKYTQMKAHPTYFITTRDAANYSKFIDCVKKYNDRLVADKSHK